MDYRGHCLYRKSRCGGLASEIRPAVLDYLGQHVACVFVSDPLVYTDEQAGEYPLGQTPGE
jgi:hypothetical protein